VCSGGRFRITGSHAGVASDITGGAGQGGGTGRREEGKQKTRGRGWIGIGKSRRVGEDDKWKDHVGLASLHSDVSIFPKITRS